ncbi:MAG: hypothetical protein RLZ32_219 [Gemmatimonadota bacterium]|jgi:hypothetical protein
MAADPFPPDDTPDPDDADADADEAEDGDEGEEGEGHPAVFVTTREPVPLRIEALDDPRAPDGSVMGTYIDDRLVARSAMPAEAIARLLQLRLFEEPVPLGLFAFEESPGVQCRLYALVPRAALEAGEHAAEPWKASVPSYEATRGAGRARGDDEEGEEGEPPPFETVLLGHIVRFAGDRRHGENLAAEAVDILQRILHGADSLRDADTKAIDDLLGSL